MYKIEIGVFEGERFNEQGKHNPPRKFIPVFSEVIITKEELVKRMTVFVRGWSEKHLAAWLHTNNEPKNFNIDDEYGYRITSL